MSNLIPCSQCQEEISALANRCPHCTAMTDRAKDADAKILGKGCMFLLAFPILCGLGAMLLYWLIS
jgi:predicted amidophosphoribosyltransferase